MKFYNHKTKELNDELIASSLRQAADEIMRPDFVFWKPSKIIEVKDVLLDIVIAIDNYTNDKRGEK